ncbi:b5822cd2-2374-4187-b57d-a2ac20279cca [Sclerotinia trifoliorum]|uniref:Defect at low temperature protein 1 n=1 Tax=Sclerotinia trifoliorum TaxID=28548 RepID=A0A8H2ZLJ6_9HELO|nr:b5822cd2-2374-4187-b57d-a2ac20279cca [Sclerotinia trifoliorum]
MKLDFLKLDTWKLGTFAYGSTFIILYIIIAGLLFVTPLDAVLQAKKNHQVYNIFVIVSCYGVTLFFGATLFLTRLWTNSQIIKAIPKTWIPVEKGDVNRTVRKMIVASLARSAVIAWDSRPRIEHHATIMSRQDISDESKMAAENSRSGREEDEKTSHDATIVIPPKEPVWGQISHNGWSSPTSPDLPSLQYITVILELPHLIEAKAVSLAPPDPQSTSQPPMPDPRAVDILQRPAAMGLRDYISHLSGLEVISDPSIAASFLSAYEYARFSSNVISEVEFRDLMKQFAELLRSMEPLSPAIMMSLAIDDQESDIDGDAPSRYSLITSQSHSVVSSLRSVSIHSGREGTIQTAPSRRPGTDHTNLNRSRVGTAPVTPRGQRPELSGLRSQSRGLYNSSSSDLSMRSASQTSVIKLSRVQTGDSLPYEIHIPRGR